MGNGGGKVKGGIRVIVKGEKNVRVKSGKKV